MLTILLTQLLQKKIDLFEPNFRRNFIHVSMYEAFLYIKNWINMKNKFII